MAGIEFGLRGLMCFEQTKCSIVCSSVCAHESSCAERVSWYRPGSVRLDTQRLNKVNTALLPSGKDRRRKEEGKTRKKKKYRVRQHKRDSRSSNITEYFPNNRSCTVLDKPTVTK